MNSETHRSAWWISLTGRQVKLQWSAGQLNIYTGRSVSNTLSKKFAYALIFRGGGGGGVGCGGSFRCPDVKQITPRVFKNLQKEQ